MARLNYGTASDRVVALKLELLALLSDVLDQRWLTLASGRTARGSVIEWRYERPISNL